MYDSPAAAAAQVQRTVRKKLWGKKSRKKKQPVLAPYESPAAAADIMRRHTQGSQAAGTAPVGQITVPGMPVPTGATPFVSPIDQVRALVDEAALARAVDAEINGRVSAIDTAANTLRNISNQAQQDAEARQARYGASRAQTAEQMAQVQGVPEAPPNVTQGVQNAQGQAQLASSQITAENLRSWQNSQRLADEAGQAALSGERAQTLGSREGRLAEARQEAEARAWERVLAEAQLRSQQQQDRIALERHQREMGAGGTGAASAKGSFQSALNAYGQWRSMSDEQVAAFAQAQGIPDLEFARMELADLFTSQLDDDAAVMFGQLAQGVAPGDVINGVIGANYDPESARGVADWLAGEEQRRLEMILGPVRELSKGKASKSKSPKSKKKDEDDDPGFLGQLFQGLQLPGQVWNERMGPLGSLFEAPFRR